MNPSVAAVGNESKALLAKASRMKKVAEHEEAIPISPCSSSEKENEPNQGTVPRPSSSGLVYWCDDNVFKAGGKRSMQHDSNFVETQAMLQATQVDKPNNDHQAESYQGNEGGSLEPEEPMECSRVFKRVRGGRGSINLENHTRIVDKALSEILGPLQVETPPPHAPTPAATKGRPGRPTKNTTSSGPQQHSQGTRSIVPRVKSVPARLKDN